MTVIYELTAMGTAAWLRDLADRLDADSPVFYTSEWATITLAAMIALFALMGLCLGLWLVVRYAVRKIRCWRLRREMRRQLNRKREWRRGA